MPLNVETYGATLLPLYQYFTNFTPVVPKLYWDVFSQEERIKAICDHINKLVAYANALGVQINTNTQEIADLLEQFDKFKEGAFDDYYEQVISAWVNNHMPEIMAQAARMVFFGLTSDGYFCAYVPDSWRDIIFDTGAVYGRSDYGRLILRYNVDGSGVIDNTYPHTEIFTAQGIDTQQLINQLAELDAASKSTSAKADANAEDIKSLRADVESTADNATNALADAERASALAESATSQAQNATSRLDSLEPRVSNNEKMLTDPIEEA